MKFNKTINIFLTVASFIMVVPFILDCSQSMRKVQFIYKELCDEQVDLLRKVSGCEAVAQIKGSNVHYDEQVLSEKPGRELPPKFENILIENSALSYKIAKVTSHLDLYTSRERLIKDVISQAVYFGIEHFSPILCEAYTLTINSVPIKISHQDWYVVPKMDTMKIEYSKYIVDFKYSKVDTTTCLRVFTLN